ncbi:RidA family protein [Marinobacter sp. X15-166B]|uniref:RidA family protein n=1 Tax=Marinobacter sp. X15-166B TaxID=1897620 RepID=UPI00085BB9E6|nr:RidA family protein [Marinobacter sp. X15-166B]OEY66027.1 hypothetical protein BG841_05850 [Marinobacter sp. X15-166B]
MQDVDATLKAMGLDLKRTNPPAGSYVPHLTHNGLVVVSGQTCKKHGQLVYRGKIGSDLDLSQGVEAAKLCGLNMVGQLYNACNGDWSNLAQCLKLTVFVNCTADFEQLSQVADGASNLMHELFGDKGKHTRSAVGANTLPGGATVEIEGIFALVNNNNI